MPHWISDQAKQQWQRWLFSVAAGLFTWWYVHETLVTTRVFTDVPLYIQGLPHGKTIGGLRKDGRLLRQFSLTLKGRKKALDIIKPDQIEVVINANNKGDVWKEEIGIDSLRCLNPEVQVERDVVEVNHPTLQIRLTSKVRRDIPVDILPPSGSLPKGYRLISIWPNHVTQTIEGPVETVQALAIRRLSFVLDLNQITKQQLERMSEELPAGSELFFKVPESWKFIHIPAPFSESRPLQDPEAEQLMLVILKQVQLPVELPIPIRISPLPLPLPASPFINRDLEIVEEPGYVERSQKVPHWVRPVYIDGISREFLQEIIPHLELVIYVGTRGTISGQFEVANIKRAERKYVERMLQIHFERSQDAEEEIQKQLRAQFWDYIAQMKFYGESHRRLDWDFTVISGHQLRIKETE